jgi:peptidyl-prolyl cis-trans isomerase C
MRIALALFLAFSTANAVQYPLQVNADTVVVTRGGEKLTFRDVDASLLSMDPINRPIFANDYQKFSMSIDQELLNRQLAGEGQRLGLDQDPVIALAMKRAADAELAKYALEIMVNEKLASTDVSALAQEVYVANLEQYKAPLTSTVAQVLIKNQGTPEESMKLAQEIAAKAKAGADFAELVQTYSSDPFKSEDKGIIVVADRTQIAKSFFDAAHAIAKVGDVTDVIETEYGLHVMKLMDRTQARQRPFDEVKLQILAGINEENRTKISKELISNLRAADPVYDEAAFEALKSRYGRVPVKGVSAPGAAIVMPEMQTVKPKIVGKTE